MFLVETWRGFIYVGLVGQLRPQKIATRQARVRVCECRPQFKKIEELRIAFCRITSG
jgi:hypothetical protein